MNITPTGLPNIIFQNTNDVIIHHAQIKPIPPNEIITTTEMFVDFLSQFFTNRLFVDFIFHEVPVKTTEHEEQDRRAAGYIDETKNKYTSQAVSMVHHVTWLHWRRML